jgi:hypothetical protein
VYVLQWRKGSIALRNPFSNSSTENRSTDALQVKLTHISEELEKKVNQKTVNKFISMYENE